MSTSTDFHKKEDPSSLGPSEELKAGSHDSSLDSAAKGDSTLAQEHVTATQVSPEEEPGSSEAEDIERADKEKETGDKSGDVDIKPVRPEQQPRGRVKPPVSGTPKPRPK